MPMRFSWRRKKHVQLKIKGIKAAQAFINSEFNNEGMYCGDNPYLANVSVEDMLLRWRGSDAITAEEYALLRRANLDHVATLVITRRDGGKMFEDIEDQRHFVDIAAFMPKDADMNMTLMQRVAVAESMELRADRAVVNLRLYEGTAIHCGEFLCKYYDYHLHLRYDLKGELCEYQIK